MFSTYKHHLVSHKSEILLFVVFMIASAVLGFHHEMWRDEAQKWLIARDLNLVQIFKQTAYEGHPFLYYFLLYPLATLGLPYYSVQLLSWAIVNTNAYLLLRYAPFHIVLKAALLFSFFFAFEYGNLAVNYAIVISLIFAIASLYQFRHDYKILYASLLFFLVNSHLLVFVFASFLGLVFIWEISSTVAKRKTKLSLFIIGSGIIGLVFQLLRPEDSAFQSPEINDIPRLFQQFRLNIYPFCKNIFCVSHHEFTSLESVLLLLLIVFLSQMKFYQMAALVVSLVWIFIVTHFFYNGEYRYYALCFVFILFFCWISFSTNDKGIKSVPARIKRYALMLILTLVLLPDVKKYLEYYVAELQYQFSGAKEMAAYINANRYLQNSTIIGFRCARTSAVCAYLGNNSKLWSPEHERFGSFTHWDTTYVKAFPFTLPIVLSKSLKAFPDQSKIIYLFNKDFFINNKADTLFETIYSNKDSIFCKQDESFVLARLR